MSPAPSSLILSRAQGCLLGQLCGDALGSAAEFQKVDVVRRNQPPWPREIVASLAFRPVIGGPTVPGQPTDDSEMALALARSLVKRGEFDLAVVREAYRTWLASGPFDYGLTVSDALSGKLDATSEANAALMRVSPLGIFGALHDLDKVARWAQEDAAITHLNPVCGDASALYAVAIAETVREGLAARQVYDRLLERARAMGVDGSLMWAITQAEKEPPRDYTTNMSRVQIALHNALYELLYAKSLEEGMVETVLHGGDTDTNAAICGALLGAVYGLDAIPQQWRETVLTCRLEAGPGVHWPRPPEYWPTDALELAAQLVGL